MKQEIYEQIKYLHRQWNVSWYCEFEKLGQEEPTIEEELIQLSLNWRYVQCITPI